MAAAAILKIHFNGHTSGSITHIYTKCGPERKTDVFETAIPSNFIFLKIQDLGFSPKNTQKHPKKHPHFKNT